MQPELVRARFWQPVSHALALLEGLLPDAPCFFRPKLASLGANVECLFFGHAIV